MSSVLQCILLAVCGYSLLNIGQAVQKFGLMTVKPVEVQKQPHKVRGILIWSVGLLMTSVSVFFIQYAVMAHSVTVAGALAGSGLAVLAVFSHFVLKEKIGKSEGIGIVLIIISAVLLGIFSVGEPGEEIHLWRMAAFLSVVSVVYIAAWVIEKIRRKKLPESLPEFKRLPGGVLIGAFAGALRGFVPIIQKVSASPLGQLSSVTENWAVFSDLSNLFWTDFLTLYGNPYFILWFVFNNASMVVQQFAFRRDKAVRIIPAYSVNFILVPIIGAMISFGEKLHPMQWFGVALAILGVAFITVFAKKNEPQQA